MGETSGSQTISTKPQWIVQGSKVMPEEPYALIGHVRDCGGSGGQPRIYPAADALQRRLAQCWP